MTEDVGAGFDRVWRPSGGARLAYWVAVGLFGLLALAGFANALGGGDVGSSLLVALVNAAVATCAWRWGNHPLIGASADGLTVRNPVRTVTVAWEDVTGCAATSRGVTIGRAGAPPVVAWAVPKPALSTWFGRATRADEVVGYIATRALAHRGGYPDEGLFLDEDGLPPAEGPS